MSIKAHSDFNGEQKSSLRHYSYDVHGNVSQVWQEFKAAVGSGSGSGSGSSSGSSSSSGSLAEQRFKHISYQYDIISNKVKEVAYQKGQPDQLLHRYKYDANNRLREVLTSTDGVLFAPDAKYFYYLHGPLARLELGELQVQGLDYVYTINGWVKGVNSSTLQPNRDIGRDGNVSADNLHRFFGRDAFGFSLHYFAGDYKAVDPVLLQVDANKFESVNCNFTSLYNGNIGAMQLGLTGFTPLPKGGVGDGLPDVMLYSYKYDQLNRFMEQKTYKGMKALYNTWAGIPSTKDYYMKMGYDANGNILSMVRSGFGLGNYKMDVLMYHYASGNNRLRHIDDFIPAEKYPDDLDHQQEGNYTYDPTGNLTSDKSEQIEKIEWYVNGKVKRITRSAGSTKPNLYFEYGADGQRVLKAVISGTDTVKQYYVRDASGNIMGIYEFGVNKAQGKGFKLAPYYKLLEQPLYGSSRLGVVKRDLYLMEHEDGAKPVSGDELMKKMGTGAAQGGKPMLPVLPVEGKPGKVQEYKSLRGRKMYELVSHLGNVHVVVSDRKIAHSTNGVDVDWFTGDVRSVVDMYPFGMMMPGRNYNASGYKWGFNGMEKVDEINGVTGSHYTAEFWEYNARTGGRENPDPVVNPSQSPYATFNGNPILNTDVKGNSPDDYTAKQDGKVEFKKTDDKFDRFLVENKEGKTNEVYRVDKPNTDKQSLVKFPSSGTGFTRYGDEEVGGDSYVQPKVAAAIFGAVNEFSAQNPDATVQLGNMSSSTGGKPGGNSIHKGGSMSHVLGRNVDVRYIRTDRGLSGVTVFDAQFDRGASQNLVNSFNKFGFKSALSHTTKDGFLLNKTTDKDIQLYNKPVHYNHIHFQGFSR